MKNISFYLCLTFVIIVVVQAISKYGEFSYTGDGMISTLTSTVMDETGEVYTCGFQDLQAHVVNPGPVPINRLRGFLIAPLIATTSEGNFYFASMSYGTQGQNIIFANTTAPVDESGIDYQWTSIALTGQITGFYGCKSDNSVYAVVSLISFSFPNTGTSPTTRATPIQIQIVKITSNNVQTKSEKFNVMSNYTTAFNPVTCSVVVNNGVTSETVVSSVLQTISTSVLSGVFAYSRLVGLTSSGVQVYLSQSKFICFQGSTSCVDWSKDPFSLANSNLNRAVSYFVTAPDPSTLVEVSRANLNTYTSNKLSQMTQAKAVNYCSFNAYNMTTFYCQDDPGQKLHIFTNDEYTDTVPQDPSNSPPPAPNSPPPPPAPNSPPPPPVPNSPEPGKVTASKTSTRSGAAQAPPATQGQVQGPAASVATTGKAATPTTKSGSGSPVAGEAAANTDKFSWSNIGKGSSITYMAIGAVAVIIAAALIGVTYKLASRRQGGRSTQYSTQLKSQDNLTGTA